MKARLLFPLCAAMIAVAIPAHAADPAYVGTWGTDAAQCKVPQEQEGAPMVITATGYDQHEAHCMFASVKKNGSAWKVRAKCSVEGNSQKDVLLLRVTGDVLLFTVGNRKFSNTLTRCK